MCSETVHTAFPSLQALHSEPLRRSQAAILISLSTSAQAAELAMVSTSKHEIDQIVPDIIYTECVTTMYCRNANKKTSFLS